MKSKLKQNILLKYFEPISYSFTLMKEVSFTIMLIRIICSLTMPFGSILIAMIDKKILNLLVSKDVKFETILSLCGITLLINFVIIVLGYIDDYIGELQEKRLEKYVHELCIECSTRANICIYDDKNYYDKLILIQNGFRTLSITFWKVLSGTGAFFSIIVTLYLFMKYNLLISICLIGICLPYTKIKNKFSKKIYDNEIEQMKDERKMDYILEVSTNKEFSQLIRLYDFGSSLKKRYSIIWEKLYQKYESIISKRKNQLIAVSFLPKVALCLNSMFLIYQILHNKLTIGDFTLYTGLAAEILSYTSILTDTFNDIYENQMILYILKEFKDLCFIEGNEEEKELGRIKKIEFKQTKFCYPNTNNYIFRGLNLEINAGKKYCILGMNGSGKSTLIKLLLRFYDVNEGDILINGCNIKQYKIESLRERFSVCFQNQKNLAFSLRDNIDLQHNSKTDDADLIALLEKCNIDSIFEKKESDSSKYLDYSISKLFEDDGIEMSGGENQRIAIVRALYRKADILILDEPSAAVDLKTENNLFNVIENLIADKTLIYITHHLHRLNFFDYILVMEDGKIVESGTLDELQKLNGRFSEIYKYNFEE